MVPEGRFYRQADHGKLPVRNYLISFSVSVDLDHGAWFRPVLGR